MKNYLLGIATVLFLGLMSFNSIQDILTVKPALPKEVYVNNLYGSELKNTIFEQSKKGFIVKSVMVRGNTSSYILIMEKY